MNPRCIPFAYSRNYLYLTYVGDQNDVVPLRSEKLAAHKDSLYDTAFGKGRLEEDWDGVSLVYILVASLFAFLCTRLHCAEVTWNAKSVSFFFTSGKDSNVLIELPTSLRVAKRKAASICQPKSPHWHGHRHRPPGARRIAVWNSRSKQGEQTVDVLVFFPSGTNGWWMSSRVFFFFFRILRCLWFEGIFLKNKIWIDLVMPIGRFERTQSNLGKWPVFGDGGYRIRCQHVRRIPRSSTWTAKLRSHPLLHLGADNQPVKLMGKHGKSFGHSATPVERKTV